MRLAYDVVTANKDARTYDQILTRLKAIGSDYPIEQALKEGLIQKDLYDKPPEACRYILWNYEEYLAMQIGANATIDEHERSVIWKARANDSIEHIEHIHPQTPSGTDWAGKLVDSNGIDRFMPEQVGRIGNLMLLPMPLNSLNSAAKAHPFDQNKHCYCQHNLRMVKEIAAEQDWNLNTIEQREARIVEWAKSRWNDLN